jgi:S-DNA-T family DNA segregation ATPase FtsK/SpoIIIE
VAGATGSGKSVFINGLLLSLLYKYTPQELQIVLVDMKRVELKLYEGVPHLLSKVITEAEKSINALKWTVLEMDRRYRLLEEHGKRNIVDYNQFAKKKGLEELPYMVFIIDELGDLMMLAKAEVEPIIVRLTQMSRAVGIHLVLGTQRPDTHVVTGLIKANVPSRIAFAVASQVDSRVILDVGGAEKLLGQGDGLMITPSSLHPIRFQGPNVLESEVRKCVDFLKKQVSDNDFEMNIKDEVTETPKAKINVPGMEVKGDLDDNGDDVYERAKNLVIQNQKASTSFLQQMLGVGYPKAAKLIYKLEEEGIVGPANGSKPRDVYVTVDVEEEF